MSVPRIHHTPDIYAEFVRTIVQTGVFSEAEMIRGSGSLGEARTKKITAGKEIDSRTPFLMTISGKGGWVAGPAFDARKPFRNISLLDHLISVTRGALILGELDLHAAGVTDTEMPARLARIAAAAFLHDADKMLERGRANLLDLAAIREVRDRYRIDVFLSIYGVSMSDDEMLAWIDAAEVSRSGRIASSAYVLSPQARKDTAYMRAADRMDGLSLDTRKGMDGALQELQNFPAFRTDAPKITWSLLRMHVPHIPFLADVIQDAVSQSAIQSMGIPPLFQSHMDGDLTMALPVEHTKAIIPAVRQKIRQMFKGEARVHINNRLAINILDGGSSFDDIILALDIDPRTAGKCLALTTAAFATSPERRAQVESMIPAIPTPSWPDFSKATGATISPWGDGGSDLHQNSGRHDHITQAAAIATVIFCTEPDDKALAKRTPSATDRYKRFVDLLHQHTIPLPDWLAEHPDDRTRKAITILLAAHARQSDPYGFGADLDEMLHNWLVGTPQDAGIFERHTDVGTWLVEPAMRLIQSSLEQTFLAADETLPYSCHFTAIPVAQKDEISSSSGIYGLKVTAFSGRSGRPENPIKTGRKGTYLSPEIVAEHRLRTLINGRDRGNLPLLVSSPTTLGLFGALGTNQQAKYDEFSSYDVLRLEIKPGRLNYEANQQFERLTRLARYEEFPGTFTDQVDFVIRMLKLARRTGRPVHAFRGAPTPTAEFVYIDSLPSAFHALFEGREGWRIEEIPAAIKLCEMVHAVASTNGLGVDLARRLMHPKTRLDTACLGMVLLDRQSDSTDSSALYTTLFNLAKEALAMQHPPSPIARFAEAMTYYQKASAYDDSNAVKELGISEALNAVQTATRAGMVDTQTLIDAVVAAIAVRMERSSSKHYASKETRNQKNLDEALANAARIFVEEVWNGTLKGRAPDTQTRQTLTGIYRVAFARFHNERRAQRVATTD